MCTHTSLLKHGAAHTADCLAKFVIKLLPARPALWVDGTLHAYAAKFRCENVDPPALLEVQYEQSAIAETTLEENEQTWPFTFTAFFSGTA